MALSFDCRNNIELAGFGSLRKDTLAHSTGGTDNYKFSFHFQLL